jgi:hypothetical protein
MKFAGGRPGRLSTPGLGIISSRLLVPGRFPQEPRLSISSAGNAGASGRRSALPREEELLLDAKPS